MCPVPFGLHDSGENLERRKRLGGGAIAQVPPWLEPRGNRSASPRGAGVGRPHHGGPWSLEPGCGFNDVGRVVTSINERNSLGQSTIGSKPPPPPKKK